MGIELWEHGFESVHLAPPDTLLCEVCEQIGGLAYFLLKIANGAFHCPLGGTDGRADTHCLGSEMICKMDAWPDEVDVVNTALIEDQFKLVFPLSKQFIGKLELLGSDTILTHDLKCGNELAEVSCARCCQVECGIGGQDRAHIATLYTQYTCTMSLHGDLDREELHQRTLGDSVCSWQ